jgi:hypothetical protein
MQNVPFVVDRPTQLVETVVQECIELMRQRFNFELDRIALAYQKAGTSTTVLTPHIEPDKYYLSEVIDPFQPPACFVIAESSSHEIGSAQNFEHTIHRLLVVLLMNDAEITRLVRSTWRMALACYRALHDATYNNSHFLVRAIDYSPLYRRKGDVAARNLAKDIMVRVEAHAREPF